MPEFDDVKVKDQLGRPEDIGVSIKRKEDFFVVEEGPVLITQSTIGHAWIVGSSTNGLVGTNTGTYDGQQQTVGGGGRSTATLVVYNIDNTFKERFRDATFKDSSTTAYWDTANFRLAMSSSSNHNVVYSTVGVFKSLVYNSGTFNKMTVSAVETKWGNDVIHYFVSYDGGSSWEEAVLNSEKTLSSSGTDLRLKIVFFGNGGLSTFVEDVKVVYS